MGEYFFYYVCIKVERELKKHYNEEVTKLMEQPSEKFGEGHTMLKDKVNQLAGKVTGMMLDGQSIEFLLTLCKS